MRFYIIFCTNVMSGLPLWCTDLRFGLPRASPPPQGPILRYFSPLLDFLLPPLHFKVQSSAISHSFWTSACLHFKVHSATLPLPTTQKRRIANQSANLIPAILIRQSNSTISMPVISQFHQVKHLQ